MKRSGLPKWLVALTFVLSVGAAVLFSYLTVPHAECNVSHYSVLIVLGCPPDPDGTPSSEGRERVMEAVREFRAGRAENLLLTGGNPHSQLPEAAILAPIALAAGIPPERLFLETRARNTIDNISYSHQIMSRYGWRSAEVVSSPSHLARTALILSHYPMCWQTHASRWPKEYSRQRIARYYIREALGTTALRFLGFRLTTYLVSTASPLIDGTNLSLSSGIH